MIKQPQDFMRSKKKPVRKAIWIAGDSELAEKLSELEADLSREEGSLEYISDLSKRESATQRAADLRKRVDDLKPQVENGSIKFVFQGIGSRAYDDLLMAHAPTEDQIRKHKLEGDGNLPFNTETFPIALIAECCVEPTVEEMPREELVEWLSGGDWNQAEILTLFVAATECNSTRRVLNLGKG